MYQQTKKQGWVCQRRLEDAKEQENNTSPPKRTAGPLPARGGRHGPGRAGLQLPLVLGLGIDFPGPGARELHQNTDRMQHELNSWKVSVRSLLACIQLEGPLGLKWEVFPQPTNVRKVAGGVLLLGCKKRNPLGHGEWKRGLTIVNLKI